MKRALTVSNILHKKRNLLPFDGQWLDAIGKPELSGTWFIYSESGHGKTTFTFQLCKYLCELGLKVGYNSMEEGDSETIKKVMLRVGMQEVASRFMFFDKDSKEDMAERLSRRNAPRVLVIDSWQYARMRTEEYIFFEQAHPSTLFIVIGHEKNGKPKGTGEAIYYHAHVKIRVLGFKAYVKTRYEGKGLPITIWEKGANEYETI